VIVAPTRELAIQIHSELGKVVRAFGRLNTAICYGGVPKSIQAQQLFKKPEIIIGTPGRLLDFASTGMINLSTVSAMVLDEADRLLDMGFEQDIR
jgi:superfamily II DNA/RNA helicase